MRECFQAEDRISGVHEHSVRPKLRCYIAKPTVEGSNILRSDDSVHGSSQFQYCFRTFYYNIGKYCFTTTMDLIKTNIE